MKDTKVQWHPGFVAAMNLELAKNRDDLIFVKEYNLNTKPLEIDLLVIKKDTDASIENEIGEIFKGHNILEYKSPQDHLDIDTFYKVVAYASLYKSYGETVDSIKADDITVSLVRDAKPVELFKYFEAHQYSITWHILYRGGGFVSDADYCHQRIGVGCAHMAESTVGQDRKAGYGGAVKKDQPAY